MFIVEIIASLLSVKLKLFIPKLIIHFLIWILAGIYLAIDTAEIFEMRQLVNITSFALFFLLSSFQVSYSRFLSHLGNDAVLKRGNRLAVLMFLAAILDVVDSCTDQVAEQFAGHFLGMSVRVFFVIGWILTSFSTILAGYSLTGFVDILFWTFHLPANEKVADSDSTL